MKYILILLLTTTLLTAKSKQLSCAEILAYAVADYNYARSARVTVANTKGKTKKQIKEERIIQTRALKGMYADRNAAAFIAADICTRNSLDVEIKEIEEELKKIK